MIVGIISILEFHLNILIETTMTIVVVLCFEISLQRQLVLSSFVLEYKAHAVDMLWTLAKHVPTFKLFFPFFAFAYMIEMQLIEICIRQASGHDSFDIVSYIFSQNIQNQSPAVNSWFIYDFVFSKALVCEILEYGG